MVSLASILGILVSMLIGLAGPIVLAVIFARKTHSGVMPILAGAGTFVVFALILEQILHFVVLQVLPIGQIIAGNPWLMGVYGGLAAGIFEETGRFLVLTFLLKKSRDWKHGVAFGIGHGGIEALLLLGVTEISNISVVLMINSGSYDALLKASSPEQATQLQTVKDLMINTSSYLYFVGGLERIFAVTCHIAFAILVLYAIRSKKIMFFGLAILLHALLDFPAAFTKANILPIWASETITGLFAVAAFLFILWSRRLFPALPQEKEPVPESIQPVS